MSSLFSLAKWRLFLTVLPLAFLFGLAKVGLHRLGWEPWAFDSLTGSLFGAATFVIAFVLSGTLGDFNSSSEMPGQISNSIETIQDGNLLIAKINPEYDPKPLTDGLINVAQTLLDWLQKQQPVADVEAALDQLNILFADLLQYGNAPTVNRAQTELARIRILINKIGSNRDSDFLGPAYALLEVFLIGAIVALLLIGADLFSENLVVSCLLFTSFTYLLLLIRDLDNPFQYDGKSSVDVDLSQLAKAQERLEKSISL
jgi:hypothetical protein